MSQPTKKYPEILSEDLTLTLARAGASVARFGDGEWRCAIGGGCTSQRPDPALARELQHILLSPKGCLVCLPGINGPRRESWMRYTQFRYVKYCGATRYGSSFITRPDNAPWIDRPEYWEQVRSLWRDQDVVLVTGDKKSLTTEMIGTEAKSVREVHGPRQHAYAEIDRIQHDIVSGFPGRVLLCLGATATVLAYRLSMVGIHAIDLGHIGMFMRHAGAYRFAADDLASPDYRRQLELMHRDATWGADGAKHIEAVSKLITLYDPATILDYGCGEMALAEALKPRRVSGYDPGIFGRNSLPKPCELVVCTDVLEHVEPAKLDAVMDHLHRCTGRVAFLVISTRIANATLPDGRNAHLSVHPAEWWIEKLTAVGWKFPVEPTIHSKELIVIAEK